MSEAEDRGSEAATEKRKRDAYTKGNRPRSRDLSAALVSGAGMIGIAVAGATAFRGMAGYLRVSLAGVAEGLDSLRFTHLVPLSPTLLLLLIPLAGAIGGMALGGVPVPGLAAPRANRLDPAAGLSRMFGLKGAGETIAAAVKIAVLLGLGFHFARTALADLAGLPRLPFVAATGVAGGLLVTLLAHLCVGLAVVAACDYPVRRWQWAQSLRMTHQQLREESRESEGAPELRGAQRRRMRAILNGGARAALADATVVLVNPTQFAVALRYRPGTDPAPAVVAKGRGATAVALREMAAHKGIAVMRQPALARALYFTARTGETIHSDLYIAVATVIAWAMNVSAQVEAELAPVAVPAGMVFDADGQREA